MSLLKMFMHRRTDSMGAAYGFAIGDFNEDGVADMAAARSDVPNVLYLGAFKSKNRK